MPALDTTFGLPTTAAATPAEAYAVTDNSAGHSSSGNEFSRMMDQALAPAVAQKTPARPDSATTTPAASVSAGRPKSPGVRGLAKAATSSSAAAANEAAVPSETTSSAPSATAASADNTVAAESSAPVAPDPAKAADPVAAVPTPVEPLPVFQVLPFAAYFRAPAGMGSNAGSPISSAALTPSPLASAPAATATASVTTATAPVPANETGVPAAKLEFAPAAPVAADERNSTETAAQLKTPASSPTAQPQPILSKELSQPAAPAASVPLAVTAPASSGAATPAQTAASVSALPFDLVTPPFSATAPVVLDSSSELTSSKQVSATDPLDSALSARPMNQAASLAAATAPASLPLSVQTNMSGRQALLGSETFPAAWTSSVQVTLSDSGTPANQTTSPASFAAYAQASLSSQSNASVQTTPPDQMTSSVPSPEVIASASSRPASSPAQPVSTAPAILPVELAGPASLATPVSSIVSTVTENDQAMSVPLPTATATAQIILPGKEKLAVAGKANAVDNAGTGVAFNDSAMKKNENTNKVAGLDVKVLPGSVTELTREKNLPPHLVVAPVNTPENRPNDLSGVPPLAGAPATETPAPVNVVDLPSLSDARMRAMERTHDMVTLHALRLMESKSDTLQVTIKPAVGTELSLELRHRNGGIEAQATVERGDFQYLNQHWPELQQKLEQRGIKLSPLGGESNLLANDNANQNDSRQQAAQEEAAMHASAFAEFASVGNFGGASARLAVDYDGWESWA